MSSCPVRASSELGSTASEATSARIVELEFRPLEPYFEKAARGILDYAVIDPDLETVRDHSRFKAMFAAADSRLRAEEAAAKSPAS